MTASGFSCLPAGLVRLKRKFGILESGCLLFIAEWIDENTRFDFIISDSQAIFYAESLSTANLGRFLPKYRN